jgi:uncharacterized protein (DUF1697 family)
VNWTPHLSWPQNDSMTKCVALLRGIAPSNPAMRNENLRRVVADLGYDSVETVISSGNVLFETGRDDLREIEAEMERAWPSQLGFTSTTIIRSRAQLEKLVEASPCGDLEHGPGSYLLATFFKDAVAVSFELPYQPPDKPYRLHALVDNTLFSVIDTTGKTPDLMSWLEREFGKEISSRTWKTVDRLLARM